MNKVYCKGWGTVYVTDDLFDVNPFDNPPTFWPAFIAAAKNIPTLESCGDGALKVLAPLLGTDASGERAFSPADSFVPDVFFFFPGLTSSMITGESIMRYHTYDT